MDADTEPHFSVPVDSGMRTFNFVNRPLVAALRERVQLSAGCTWFWRLVLTLGAYAEHKSKVLRLYSLAWPHHRRVFAHPTSCRHGPRRALLFDHRDRT